MLTEHQRQFIQNLPPGCAFYYEDSLRDLSRTIRVQPRFGRSSYILHVEYDEDPDGTIISEKMREVKALYGTVEQQQEDEFICPF